MHVCAFVKAMRNFRLVSDAQVVPPWSIPVLVRAVRLLLGKYLCMQDSAVCFVGAHGFACTSQCLNAHPLGSKTTCM